MRFVALRLEVLALRLQETSLGVLAETRRAMTQKVTLKLFSICEKRHLYGCFFLLKIFHMILILSSKFDHSTNSVCDWLNHMGEDVVRLNKDDCRYSFEYINAEGVYFYDNIMKVHINLLDARSCWWRRTGLSLQHFSRTNSNILEKDSIDISYFTTPNNPTLQREFRRLREYIYHRIFDRCSINLGIPVFDFNRLTVLEQAKQCGLIIPEYSIVTNSVQLNFFKQKWGKIVTKAISNGLYDDINGYRYYTYTELLEDDVITSNDKVDFFPSLLTKMVDKKFEIRSFYIEGVFFSMAIFSQSSEQTKIDFRKYDNNRTEPFRLPKEIENKMKRLFSILNLNCGSIDFIVDKSDDYIFLEINPVGQYGMTDFPCNYNLDYKIANYLRNGKVTQY